jgi:hypothetical protein
LPEIKQAPSWTDPRWTAALNKLSPNQQLILKNSLRALLLALSSCRDPMRDKELRIWLPSKWYVPHQQAREGEWIEYRLGDDDNRARAIVCFDRKADVIYLVARTPIHDHASLRELTSRFRP